MSTAEWVAVVAVVQTTIMMIAGYYTWTTGRQNKDIEDRFTLFKAELEIDRLEAERVQRHLIRGEVQQALARIEAHLDHRLRDVVIARRKFPTDINGNPQDGD